jgi:hypothetical protein
VQILDTKFIDLIRDGFLSPCYTYGDSPCSHGVLTFFLDCGEIAVPNAIFIFKKKKSVGVCTAIMAIARRSCCDYMAFTLRLFAICGRLYRVLNDSTTLTRHSYCDLSVFIACSNSCLPMMTEMKNKLFFCIMVPKNGKAKI